jgi:hypothetical protein
MKFVAYTASPFWPGYVQASKRSGTKATDAAASAMLATIQAAIATAKTAAAAMIIHWNIAARSPEEGVQVFQQTTGLTLL